VKFGFSALEIVLVAALFFSGCKDEDKCELCNEVCCEKDQSCVYNQCCGWKHVNSFPPHMIESMWGSSYDNVIAVGCDFSEPDRRISSGIFRFEGNGWYEMKRIFDVCLNGVGGTSASNVFAVGEGRDPATEERFSYIAKYDGNTWTEMEHIKKIGAHSFFTQVWADSGLDVFSVGYRSEGTPEQGFQYSYFIYHYDGTDWTEMLELPGGVLSDVWGSSASDVYAVGILFAENGMNGFILHYDGSNWSNIKDFPGEDLWAIWGSSGNDIYAVGEVVVHFDGSEWSEVDAIEPGYYDDVFGGASDDVFVVGDDNFHFNGQEWTEVVQPETCCISRIWKAQEGYVWGAQGYRFLKLDCE